MIINKDGKLFGKISVIDILVIFIVIIIAFGIYSRFSKSNDKIETKMQEIIYTMKINDVRQGTVDALNHKGKIANTETKEEIGEIISVTSAPAVLDRNLPDGTIITTTVPGKFDVEITVKVDGKVNNSGFYTSNNQAINSGSKILFSSKYAKTQGTISQIKK